MKLMRSLAGLLLAGVLVSGCGGGPWARLDVERPATFDQPVWVGVYFLSQETALDEAKIADLIDKPEKYTASDGVVDKEVFPVYPGGEGKMITRDKLDEKTGWILVVGNFPKAQPCARDKRPLKKGEKFKVTVDAECLTVEKK